jgi:hypothetical protein
MPPKRNLSVRIAKRKVLKAGEVDPPPGKAVEIISPPDKAGEVEGPKKIVAILFEGKLVRVEAGEDVFEKTKELTGGISGKLFSYACFEDEEEYKKSAESLLSNENNV